MHMHFLLSLVSFSVVASNLVYVSRFLFRTSQFWTMRPFHKKVKPRLEIWRVKQMTEKSLKSLLPLYGTGGKRSSSYPLSPLS